MTTSTRHRTPGFWRECLDRINWSALLGIVLLVACAYIVATQYQAGQAAERRGECQTHVNEDLVHSLRVRDQVNQRIRDAQREVVRLRIKEGPDHEAVRQADLRYLEALQGADRSRAVYPIPAVIRC